VPVTWAFGGAWWVRYSRGGDMIPRLVTASVVLLTAEICVGDDKKDDNKDDKDRLQGEWAVVSVWTGGRQVKDGMERKLFVKGDEWTAPGGLKFKLKLDMTGSPKQIDLTSEGGQATLLGIYKIEGETLTFCQSRLGGKRPTEFKGDPTVFLMVCKRAGK
jgi:uncharacterized protein (TIGR03067 family)